MHPSLIVSQFSEAYGRLDRAWPLAPSICASAGMQCCVMSYGSEQKGYGLVMIVKIYIYLYAGPLSYHVYSIEDGLHNNADETLRLSDSQTCRALVYRHSCTIFALAWFYHRISLPPAVELESEHSSLSFSLSQRDTQLILWASKIVYVRDMTGLWPALPLIR